MDSQDQKPKPTSPTKPTRTKTNSYCTINATKGAQYAAAFQIIHGVLYLLYSIISWMIDSFPRVHSGFETYYAFGQPVLTSLLGLCILISIIVSDFNVKAVTFTCWTVVQLALIGVSVYRITRFFQDDKYIKMFETRQGYLVTATCVSVLIIFVQCLEIAAVMEYVCQKAKEEDALHKNDPIIAVNGQDQMSKAPVVSAVPNKPVVTYVYASGYPPVYRRPYYDDSGLLVLGLLAGSTAYDGCYYDDYYW